MIELKNLAVGYSFHKVLENVDLSFRHGEVTALVGVNGSGKSTLIRTAMGLQSPLEGAVLLDGSPVHEIHPKERAKQMAYLAQFRSVPNITVERMVLHGRFPHLSYPRTYRQEDRERVRRAMEQAGVAELAHRPLNTLSGGQRQRVYLAMVLAQDASYVFFDEPTTYMDVGHQLEMMDIARALAAEGRGVVLAIHDLCLALRGADRIVVLSEGRACAKGTAEEIWESGVLGQVFGVEVRRTNTPAGWRYYYE